MSIPEIVEKYRVGQKFRDIESEEAQKLAGLDNIVIDTGGGVIERPENIEVLKIKLPHILVAGFRGCHRLANSRRHPASRLDRRKDVYPRGLRGSGATDSQIQKRRSLRDRYGCIIARAGSGKNCSNLPKH